MGAAAAIAGAARTVAESNPPAYARRSRAPGVRRLIAAQVLVLTATSTVSGELLAFRWPLALTSADVIPLSGILITSGIGGIVVGVCLGVGTKGFVHRHLAAGTVIASLAVQICPWLYWLAFDGRIAYRETLVTLAFVCGAGLATLATWTVKYAVDMLTPGGLVRMLVSPFWLSAASILFVTLATFSALASMLLVGAVLSVALLAAAIGLTLGSRSRTSHHNRVIRWLCAPALAVTFASVACANRCLPLAVARASNYMVAHFKRGRVYDLRVTSGQEALHVIVGSRLRFSTLDHNRWASALTQPALARVPCPRRALVFSLGEGLAERELLRRSCIQSITSVVRDRIAVDAAQRQPWWRVLISDAWHSPRVHVIEQDPAVWLAETSDIFDLVIVDLPDPDNYVDAKYFTRYFYRETGKHLSASAVIVVQATSALRSPKTFATIEATLKDARYHTLAYRVAMTTLGEWYFLLASLAPLPEPSLDTVQSPGSAQSLQSFVVPPDARSAHLGRVSRLDDPAAMDAFLEESGDESL